MNEISDVQLNEIFERTFTQETTDKFDLFKLSVFNHFNTKTLSGKTIHSVKERTKEKQRVIDKLKKNTHRLERGDNVLEIITDFVGVRVLVLYTHQIIKVHEYINKLVNVDQDWAYFETPKAYTWDPELSPKFKELGLNCEQKESLYTSLHYVVKPKNSSLITCEIQLRTLYEEIWGEIDHQINYPIHTTNKHCIEQIKVLARLTSTGYRLADSIYNSSLID